MDPTRSRRATFGDFTQSPSFACVTTKAGSFCFVAAANHVRSLRWHMGASPSGFGSGHPATWFSCRHFSRGTKVTTATLCTTLAWRAHADGISGRRAKRGIDRGGGLPATRLVIRRGLQAQRRARRSKPRKTRDTRAACSRCKRRGAACVGEAGWDVESLQAAPFASKPRGAAYRRRGLLGKPRFACVLCFTYKVKAFAV